MNMTTYIIDDEAHAVDVIKNYVARTPELELIGTATDPISALAELTGKNPPMLLFLDVDMPGMSGLELGSLINKDTNIIFITSYREFGVEAFELSAVDYLLKPISYARFFNAVSKVKEEHAQHPSLVKERPFFFVKGGVKDKFIKIVTDEILYVAAALNYIDLHLITGKVTTYLTLSEILPELPSTAFCQIHRSYIINRNGISTIEKSVLCMQNGAIIPIGKAYQDAFLKWLDPSFLVSKRLKDD